MILQIGKRRIEVSSFAEASAEYGKARGRGASARPSNRMPEGQIFGETGLIARVSYNGRVWRAGEWSPDDVPLYDSLIRKG
jgi:hypothetical protein